ncbi:GH1 family beta-glucosidase [Nibricoccus sp. IMCC34717]|uniref:GH1 family beta-glucosidase n=1 Tax=Nibricoccus sp. IMCC34717 TaxID=3034021 RepID=UPI00384C1519
MTSRKPTSRSKSNAAQPPFHAKFAWGASTAAFQIEGALAEHGRGPSIWEVFCSYPGKVYKGDDPSISCDHYHRYKEDVALMRAIGLNAYRFSIAWSRVLPKGVGTVNKKGLDFYDRLVDELLKAGIDPYITLYHWDLPWALHLRGGWLNPDSPKWFGDYAALVGERLGDRVKHWITLNEPQVFLGLGYTTGAFAPGARFSLKEALQASHHVLLAHGRGVASLRANVPKAKIGWAPVGICSYPESETPENIAAARTATFSIPSPGGHSADEIQRSLWNSSWWMDPVYLGRYPKEGLELYRDALPEIGPDDMKLISQPVDFFGANHYHGDKVAAGGPAGWVKRPQAMGNPFTTYRWEVTPPSIYWAARFFSERYKLPIVITENGITSTDMVDPEGRVNDSARQEFLRRYLSQLARAAREGIPVDGYFHWSLMDNFEWAEGYAQRFGLVHVDFETRKRTPKASAQLYRSIIESGGAVLEQKAQAGR